MIPIEVVLGRDPGRDLYPQKRDSDGRCLALVVS
jgi:hypothetical protein